ncbi:helix-turn-helix transcriptional regulator [Flavobacterium ajazii]|uniref:helix-turn-helix transcriptional regulator n=1 Tax=Flavobacterium ajazii TaxID=2692318 RepID=UPI0013CFF728|nr:hypothetical protein [Flavobacterium ajazii]
MIHESYDENLDFDKIIRESFEIIKKSESLNYEEGIVVGNMFVADVLAKQGEYKKSLEYIKKIKKFSKYLSENPTDDFNLLILQYENCHNLGLNSLAQQYFKKAEKVGLKVKHEGLKAANLFNLYTSYDIIGKDQKSIYHYLNRARKLFDIEKYKEIASYKQDKILLNISFGNYFLKKDNKDSTKFYYELSLKLLKKEKDDYLGVYAHKGLSKLYEQQNNIAKALEHRLKSIEMLGDNPSSIEDVLDAYLSTSKIYDKLGDNKNEKYYRDLYTVLNDSIEKNKSKARDFTVIHLLEEQKQEIEKTKSTSSKLQIIILIVVLIISILGYFKFRNYNQRRKDETQSLLKDIEEYEEKLEKNNIESQVFLLEKREAGYNDLIDLGKKNHPNFYNYFKELYPSLHEKLIEIDPNLQLSELILCAYLYLDFTTKEIAIYTFKSFRTIQNRKYTLRKKLNVPTSEDIYVWMKML